MSTVIERLTVALADRYAITRELGQGGMATVFLAIDARHERPVAIKVLHPELSAMLGGERFLAEIKLTANLQHPNILPLFDSGVADGLLFYVMPYVEGETLRRRLDRERQLPIADAVRLATEIADALQYAHERGIIHRDIKPENVLLQSGRAVVADFGIALAVQQAGGTRMTQTGMSLGTPQYMAPEQAMGERNIDARADVYALGVMTYEMLAGEPPFTGPTAQAIVAKVMTERARPLSASRDTVPAYIADAVATAIAKLPADRFASAASFAQAIDAATHASGARTRTSGPSQRAEVSRGSGLRTAIIAVVALLVGAGGASGLLRARGGNNGSTSSDVAVRFAITPPDSIKLRLICCGQLFAISPDGRWLVFQGSAVRAGTDSASFISTYGLYVRDLTDLNVRALPRTDSATAIFFSPNSTEIAFVSGKRLYRLALSGSEPQPVAEVPDGFVGGGSWTDDGQIVLAVTGRMLRVPISGGSLQPLFPTDRSDLQFGGPQLFSREAVILYTQGGFGRAPQVVWRSLSNGKMRIVMEGATPTYLAETRTLLVVREDGALMQYPFELSTGDTTGPGVRLAGNVVRRSPIVIHAEYSVSRTGTVVLAARRDVWGSPGLSIVDQAHGGTVRHAMRNFAQLGGLLFSLSTERFLVAAATNNSSAAESYIYDIRRDVATRAPVELQGSYTWTRGADSLLYTNSQGELMLTPVDGREVTNKLLRLRDWIPDGDPMSMWGPWIALGGQPRGDSAGTRRIGVAHRDSLGRVRPLLRSRFSQTYPVISPDGRWIAYVSDENGRSDVFVSAFPFADGRVQLSTDGGEYPGWSKDSRTVFYQRRNQIMAVELDAESASRSIVPRAKSPRVLYQRDPWGAYDISPDGKTLVFTDRVREGEPQSLVINLHAVTNH